MVDAARQMLDELMGRNRNLHPSEAQKSVNWEDPDYCPYHLVKFCPHELFVNTRADLGPCNRIHDEEAKRKYEDAKPSNLKKQYEDEFLYFCNSMLNDVDRKIVKGRQRLSLMQRDQAPQTQAAKLRDQLNNLNARINKLVAEAEEAGIRGDVDQAQDLMTQCEQLKDERDVLVPQYEHEEVKLQKLNEIISQEKAAISLSSIKTPQQNAISENSNEAVEQEQEEKLAVNGEANEPATTTTSTTDDNKLNAWMTDMGHVAEKQMEVCEVCGAFLIVGDAQQRIEDHLMGKQHLGYSKLRKAAEEIHERRKKDREEDERRRRERSSSQRGFDTERKRDRDYGGRSRDHGNRHRHHDNDRHKRHHHKSHRRRSHSRSRSHRKSHDSRSRSRSRSRY